MAKKGSQYTCPPKQLRYAADLNALQGYAHIIKQQRAKEHYSRMSGNKK